MTFAFDVYGTLVNPHTVIRLLRPHLGEGAAAFSIVWRQKQLEYSFRRALMGEYCDFSVVTSEALDFACLSQRVSIPSEKKEELLQHYKKLDPFDDVVPALTQLAKLRVRLIAFSNGTSNDIGELLHHADIAEHFDGVVSVSGASSFKPAPQVYRHFEAETSFAPEEICLVSSNPFDVCGAMNCQWKAVWVRRSSDMVFDGWGQEPTATIVSLRELPELLDVLQG